ncbi:MAG: hypothetical protein J6V09_01100 [Clostridia bacterium]|nr:hypothetical protein [Clostridia bacterium]
MTDESASPAPLGDAENKPIITHSEKKSNTPGENSSKNPPKKRFALPETDSEGAELTSDQRKYFDASKQLDSEGRLQVMYQGAPEEFFTFDKKKSKASNLYGRGFYFTNSADQARHYGTVRGYYLNITNPLSATKKTISRMQMRKFLNAVAENEDYSIENYGTYDVAEVLRSVYGKSDFAMLYDVSLTAIGDLVEAVELFNQVNGTEYDGFILDTESVIFRSEQAKLTSNTAPSSNPDIRFALTDYTEEQYNSYGWARANDILNVGQNKDYRTKFAEAAKGSNAFAKSKDGEWMLPISDIDDPNAYGINNIIVYAKGTIDKPIITRVLLIKKYNETDLSDIRSEIYALERKGIRQETSGIFILYTRADVPSYENARRSLHEGERNNNQLGIDRGTSGGTAETTARETQGSPLKKVHTFTDITGKKRNVIRVSSTQYMIEGDNRSQYQPSIEAAEKAENERIMMRYAKAKDKTLSYVRAKYAVDKNFLKGFRFALSDTTAKVPDVAIGSVERLIRPTYQQRVEEAIAKTKSGFVPGIIATEIQFSNAQAGIEHAGKKLGVTEKERGSHKCVKVTASLLFYVSFSLIEL